MTTPTRAQIEAATEAFHEAFGLPVAEIDDDRLRKIITAALTAAAEVGAHRDRVAWTDDDAERFIDETIERCARVVENFDLSLEYRVRDTIKAIAAAIRALKDS